jgi:hypothetical protein
MTGSAFLFNVAATCWTCHPDNKKERAKASGEHTTNFIFCWIDSKMIVEKVMW